MSKLLFCCLLLAAGTGWAFNHGQDLKDFQSYVKTFNKTYASTSASNFANYYFIYNRNQVAQHNAQADRNRSSFREEVNQFSDIRLIQFAALLPKAVSTVTAAASDPPTTQMTATAYDIIKDFGLTVAVEDQGVNCSSSWAYATAKAVEILNAVQTANPTPASLSAQELIDCAGMASGCSTQSPLAALNYLTQMAESYLYPEVDYVNDNSLKTPGMCQPPSSVAVGVKLASYVSVADNDDDAIMRYVSNGFPVIVEYNPATFGFMQYSSGVYVQETRALTNAKSSQFLVVVGYDHDVDSNLDYWRCLNSFGETWGEDGYIRIVRRSNQPIAKNAVFPSALA
ncbi:zingipain-1 [Drosophila elegans]|uniref:zingipain-1 n=1 Tax=Drosophila elegans TaxID=30023 RepID=UPI0007E5BD5B|nr:zingipain-1 [Drosophila elegans]